MNIYLTQKIGEDMLWNIAVNDAGAEYDPLTLLRTRTMFGRPDWKSIYSKMRMAIESGYYLPGTEASLRTSVGTFFCGVSVVFGCLLFVFLLTWFFLFSRRVWQRLSEKRLSLLRLPESTSSFTRSISSLHFAWYLFP